MFANHLRRSALALAGGALIATSLMTSIAVAAPADSLPVPSAAESVAAKPKIDLANANVRINLTNHIGTPTGVQEYYFNLKNYGPDVARVKVEREKISFDSSGQMIVDKSERIYSMAVGEVEYLGVTCYAPEGGSCYGASMKATLMNGLDPDLSNNFASFHNPL